MQKLIKFLAVLLTVIYAAMLIYLVVELYTSGSGIVDCILHGTASQRYMLLHRLIMTVLSVLMCLKRPPIKRRYILLIMAALIFIASLLKTVLQLVPIAAENGDAMLLLLRSVFSSGGFGGDLAMLIIAAALFVMCNREKEE